MPGPLVVSGKVVDAATRSRSTRVPSRPGGRFQQGDQVFWNRQESFIATDGRYEIRQTRGDAASLIRIEADGYRSAVSREIQSDEGTISIDFALTKGTNVVAKVVTPHNLPAAGAKVALGVVGSQINVMNGDIADSQTYAPRTETDDAGRFHFPAQDKDFQLVIAHPSGFAHIKSKPDWDSARIIRLEPWCRVEGTFRVGKSPAANVRLDVDVFRLNSFGQDAPGSSASMTRPPGRMAGSSSNA